MTMTNTATSPLIQLQGKTYDNFINAIKSSSSKSGNAQSLRRYLNHRKLTQLDDLLLEQNRGIKMERWNRNA
jgi:hypothetical protein